MNELNQLEKQLESWIPRRPSARLKQRLFPAVALPVPERATTIPLWARFAAATCIVLLATVLGMTPRENTGYLAVSGGSNALASLSANLLDFCATNTRSVQCNVAEMPDSRITFEWTSNVHSLSTTGSFLSWKTNLQKL